MNLENLKFGILKNSSKLKPLFVCIVLVGPPLGLYFGYYETERVWANLAYINGDNFQHEFDSIFYETTKDLGYTSSERDSVKQLVKVESESWPISLLTKLVFDTLTNSGIMVHRDSTQIEYRYSDQLIFNKETSRFSREFRMEIQDSLLMPQIAELIQLEMDSLNALRKNELVSFVIVAWTDTDEAIVKFQDY